MRVTVRVWKVTEYDVTMDVPPKWVDSSATPPEGFGNFFDVHAEAIAMAERDHTTDFVGEPGVINRGTFPKVMGIREIRSE